MNRKALNMRALGHLLVRRGVDRGEFAAGCEAGSVRRVAPHWVVIWIFLVLHGVAGRALAAAPATPDFGRDIRPILADKCFTCHGPDENQRQAGLRLDLQESALGEADSGAHAIVPNEPDESEMIVRITSDDESIQMPPPDSDVTLEPEEIERLRQWIAAGAAWEQHWAFNPPQRPALPSLTADSAWPRNEIDYFIAARLESEGLQPNARGRPDHAPAASDARSDRIAPDIGRAR